MARKRRTGKKLTQAQRVERFQFRLKWMSVLLMVVLVGGIVSVKYFKSTHGRIALLDSGFHSYYAWVSDEVGVALKSALEEFDLRRRIDEEVDVARVGGKTINYRLWDIPCDPATNLVLVNVALTQAARKIGATVSHSEEMNDGNTLVFHVGSRRYNTHRLTIHKMGQPTTAPEPLPRLAIVIDDFGYTRGGVPAELIAMDLPLTISVLPELAQSSYMFEEARKSGKCTILHLPMESRQGYPSDTEVITTRMGDKEIARLVERYLGDMPGVVGVNNHQGSRATEDSRVMRAVLSVIGRHKLFFLDSLTSSKSVAYNTARELGLPAARNNIFLDDDTEDSEIVEQRLRRAVKIARRDGKAIAIGHPHPWTLEAIRNNRGFLRNADVDLVYLSALVH